MKTVANAQIKNEKATSIDLFGVYANRTIDTQYSSNLQEAVDYQRIYRAHESNSSTDHETDANQHQTFILNNKKVIKDTRNSRYKKYHDMKTSQQKEGSSSKVAEFKCVFCQRRKTEDDFSPFLIQKYRRKPTTVIQCLECSAGSIRTHLVCGMCSRKLALSKFSKRQRRVEKGNPRCIKCVNLCLEENVWETSSSDDDDDF